MNEYRKQMNRLEQCFEGVSDPHSMGTSGLIGWVCVAHGVRLYRRVRTALKIIRTRRLSVIGFCSALLQHAPDECRRQRIQRYCK